LLVVIPLFIGTALNRLLEQTWLATDQTALKERQRNAFVRQLGRTVSDWNTESAALTVRALNNEPASSNQTRASNLPNDLRELLAMAGGDPEQQSTAEHLRSLVEREHQLITVSNVPMLARDAGHNLPALQRSLAALFEDLTVRSNAGRLLHDEWQRLIAQQQKDDLPKLRIKIAIYSTAAIVTVIGAIVMVAIAGSLRDKLNILLHNASLIYSGQYALKKLAGKAEFAYINRVLEETADTIHRAHQHRQSVINMVAHDIRSPIMSAHIYATMIEAASDQLPAKARGAIRACVENLESVTSFANELLSNSKVATNSDSVPLGTTISSPPTLAGRNGIIRATVFKKMMAVIALPMLFQAGFFALTAYELGKAEAIVVSERRTSEIMMRACMIELDAVKGSMIQGMYLLAQAPKLRDGGLRCFVSIEQQLNSLPGLCNDDPDWLRFISLEKRALILPIQQLNNVRANTSFASIAIGLNNAVTTMDKLPEAKAARTLLQQLYRRDAHRFAEMERSENQIMATLTNIFAINLLGNIALAFALLLALNHDIARKIRILETNAMKLGSGQPLTGPRRVDDEFSQLNDLLFAAAEQLKAAAMSRAELTGSMMQQFQLPLIDAISQINEFQQLAGDKLSDSNKNKVGLINRTIEEILTLLDDLLMLENLQIGQINLTIGDFDLAAVTNDAIEIVIALASTKQISICNECPHVIIQGDKRRIVQALINYLSNAIKFCPDGSSVNISAAINDRSVRICVRDDGPGMDAATIERVFDKNFQAETDHKQKGFGLGLAVCKMIAESHGGNVGVESTPHQGSTFWLEIPTVSPKE
jgi:signal transduction histidine kinase